MNQNTTRPLKYFYTNEKKKERKKERRQLKYKYYKI